MNRPLTLGSLFDGIGGFPLAGIKAGVRPIWASEIEPFPIRVTTKRLPQMRHLGDIHGLRGDEIDPVDIITFGSPCQNLSVAGKRAGLSGAQSSLFFEAVRIIREMREKTNGAYPRWAVWENVPGALSSCGGRDFRQVLESLLRVKDTQADVPMPDKSRWLPAGEILGNDYSLAWRILDASKGWGVAQRRRRVFAVLDLDGQRAGKVLFESEGLSGYTPPGGAARQGAAGKAPAGAGASCSAGRVVAFEPGMLKRKGGHCWEEVSGTLRADMGDNQAAVAAELYPADSRIEIREDGICRTLCSRMGTDGNQVPLTSKIDPGSAGCDLPPFAPEAYGIGSDQSGGMLSDNPHVGIYEANTSRTLDRGGGNPTCKQGGMAIVETMAFTQNQREEVRDLADRAGALSASPGIHQQTYVLRGGIPGENDDDGPCGHSVSHDARVRELSYCMTVGSFAQIETEMTPTLEARGFKDPPVVGKTPPCEYTVRRLTPGECARLQGYPDGWCEGLETPEPTEAEIVWWSAVFETFRKAVGKSGKPRSATQIAKWLKNPHKDAAKYKAYGNSVAVPCVFFVLAGIVWAKEMEGDP